MNSTYPREVLLQSIRDRNRRECPESLSSIIKSYNTIQDSLLGLRKENARLQSEKERLTRAGISQQTLVARDDSRGDEANAAIREEMTALLKYKSQAAGEIAELAQQMRQAEKQILEKGTRITEQSNQIEELKTNVSRLDASLAEQTAKHQLVRDEYEALQIAYARLEENFRRVSEDNNDLIQRWMKQKEELADHINRLNNVEFERQQEKVRFEIAQAASEPANILESGFVPVGFGPPARAIHHLDAHEGEVNAVSWSTAGYLMATGGGDRKVKVWHVGSAQCQTTATLVGSNQAIMSIDFDSRDMHIAAGSSDFASRVWKVNGFRLETTLTGHSNRVSSIKFMPDANLIATGSADRTLKLWDYVRSKACTKTLFAGSACYDLVTPNGQTVVSGHHDKQIRIWDIRAAQPKQKIDVDGLVTSLCLLPDKRQVLACTRNNQLVLVDLISLRTLRTFSAEGFRVGSDHCRAVFSPEADFVAAGSMDGPVFLWKVEDGSVVKCLKEHENAVYTCAWQPAGAFLATGDRQKKVILWAA